ncbi:hypothetical protein BCR34DRAFT_244171 [Clohesyomyces aquaticus]|uniref:Uncharacterized protein n=1 Tax=Clohesyomyces aquaticus TaxID=1231657 RepID=A0A1Y1ZW62_9PLEO|nr:hypothetical protein BCR34DRAFT_244171 [Clohesyomyces aquaticus]
MRLLSCCGGCGCTYPAEHISTRRRQSSIVNSVLGRRNSAALPCKLAPSPFQISAYPHAPSPTLGNRGYCYCSRLHVGYCPLTPGLAIDGMSFVSSLAVFALLWLSSLVSAKPLRPRGFDTIAPYSNLTSISTSPAATPPPRIPPVLTKSPPYPIPGTGSGLISTDNGGRPKPTDQGTTTDLSASNNDSLASCTVNIPRANIDWWYLATYDT